jgi:hypothetical protein
LVVDVLLHQQGTFLVNHLMTETGALMSVNATFASIVKQIKQGQQHARGALRHHHYPSIHHHTHTTTTHIDTPPISQSLLSSKSHNLNPLLLKNLGRYRKLCNPKFSSHTHCGNKVPQTSPKETLEMKLGTAQAK